MTDRMSQHRSSRLREYLGTLAGDEESQRRAFMQRTGYTKGRVSQLLRDGFGERSASSITSKLRLRDPRWFERPLGTPVDAPPAELSGPGSHIKPLDPGHTENALTLSPDEHRLLEAFHLLPESEQAELLREMDKRAARYQEVVERVMRRRGAAAADESGDEAGLPTNVRAPHFPSTRGRLIAPPGKPAPAAGTSGPPRRPGGKTGRRE